MTNNSNYSEYGAPVVLTEEMVDPVQNCVGNNYFTKNGITSKNQEINLCNLFMGKRCGVKPFDDYCELYLHTSKTDTGGFNHLNRKFLETAANEKFCRANTDAPGAQCSLECAPFDPTSNSSPQICNWIGTQNWMDTKSELDLAGNYIQTSMLNPISPTYMDACPMICDGNGIKEITDDDAIINHCIDAGACSDTLMELSYYVTKNNIPVSNKKFQKYLDLVKQNKPFNPNIVSRIARSYGIPASDALDLLYNSPATNQSKPSGVSKSINTQVSPPANKMSYISPTNPYQSKKEGYAPIISHIKQNISLKTIGGISIGILIIAAIIWLVIKYSKSK